MYERMAIICQGKLRGRWAPSRAGCWHQYWECRSSGVSLWDIQSTSLLQRGSLIPCSRIWFSLWLSAETSCCPWALGFSSVSAYVGGVHEFWGRLQRVGWAISLYSSNRTYTGNNFVATAVANLQLLKRETTFSVIIVHASSHCENLLMSL